MRHSFTIAIIAGLTLAGIHALWVNSSNAGNSQAQHLNSYRWQLQEGWFGGFSGLLMSDDGTLLTTVSDRGTFVQARIVREGDRIARTANVTHSKVLRANGHFPKRNGLRDSEGLARKTNGSIVVSFEGEHRLEQFVKPGAPAKKMPWHPDFDRMAVNGGFEALAMDKNGVLFTMPEQPIGEPSIIQVFALDGSSWRRAFTLKRRKQFQPVGADFGPDGRLYVLERGFNTIGFRTRVRSFAINDTGAFDEKLMFSKGLGVHDNLEGLAVWRDELGRIRLTMISDDNFRLVQRTEIVEYVIPQ